MQDVNYYVNVPYTIWSCDHHVMDGYHILPTTKPFGWINVEVLCFGWENLKVRHAQFWPQTEVAFPLLAGGEKRPNR